MTRIYFPATVGDLRTLVGRGSLRAEPAYAATDRLAAAYPDADDEELAYAAMTAAGQEGTPPRIVVAADVGTDEHPEDDGVVTPVEPVTLDDVASFHVDAGGALGEDLAWYATQELDDLVAELERGQASG